jgi:hypothetical protein
MDKWNLYHDTVPLHTTPSSELCLVLLNSMTITAQKPNVRARPFCVLVISCLMQSYHYLKTEILILFFLVY